MKKMIVGGFVLGAVVISGVLLSQKKPVSQSMTVSESGVAIGETAVTSEVPSEAPNGNAVKGKTFSLAEVQKHTTAADCWMAIAGKVYDATEYVGKHPGGKAIIPGCGKDATELFNERPNTKKSPHPDAATKALNELYIGDLVN
jgi:cytochrome b involved in lipid metabolism